MASSSSWAVVYPLPLFCFQFLVASKNFGKTHQLDSVFVKFFTAFARGIKECNWLTTRWWDLKCLREKLYYTDCTPYAFPFHITPISMDKFFAIKSKSYAKQIEILYLMVLCDISLLINWFGRSHRSLVSSVLSY